MWVESEEEASEIITAVCKMQPMDRPAIKPRIHKRLATDDLRVDMFYQLSKACLNQKQNNLIEEFGSIMEIGEQKAYEITKMEGIGPTVANRILDTLNSEDKVTL